MTDPTVLPANFHARYDQGPQSGRSLGVQTVPVGVEPALRRMADEVPALQVELDDVTGLPLRIASGTPGSRLGSPQPSPREALTAFVDARGEIWGLDREDAATVEVVSVSRQGLRTVRLVQRVDGVEVFGSNVTAAVDGDNALIAVTGQFFAGAGPALRAAADRAAALAPGSISASAEEAIARAASDLTRAGYAAEDFAIAGAMSGTYRGYDFRSRSDDRRPSFDHPVRVKDVLYPFGAGRFAAGWYLELWVHGFPAFSYVVAAEPPFILYRKNLRAHVAFSYRVHNTGDALFRPHDGPAPGSPHPTGEPDGFQAAALSERLVRIESLLPGDPWLPDDATETRGNNCIAYADLKSPQGESTGDVVGAVTSTRTFDYAYDHSKDATDDTNLQNSLVGMFFHVNWLHDRWYAAGFDEAAGNAQQDNYGRGGLDGEPVLAEGNDFSGTDNANMETPADGSSPRMQMFEFLGPTPDNPSRTSNHEALITFHEMGHYITNRLVGDAAGLTNQQGLAMGEGWGDFFAVCMTSQATDDFGDGAFPIGGWTDLTPTFNDNYYYSIRRFPYSADTGKNPLRFKHITAGVALPTDAPINPTNSSPNHQIHTAGEVWCVALWDVFVNLVDRHGHPEAERRMLLYVIGGLELTPDRPTFLQARDGIITTVAAIEPSDLRPVWAGFAKRGMGVGAVAPRSDSVRFTGVVESFDIPADLPPEPPGDDVVAALASATDLLC